MEKKEKNPQDVQYSKKKIRVAILCISAVLVFVVGSSFLKGINIFHKKSYYYCEMTEASGVQQSTPVYLAGYKIGQVQEVELVSSNPPLIRAKILVTEDVDIPNDSKLLLKSSSILGGMQLDLQMGKSATFFKNEETIQCVKEVGMLDGIDGLKAQLGSVMSSVDTIGLEIKDLFHKDGGGQSLRNTLANVEDITGNLSDLLADNEGNIDAFVSSLKKFGKTLDEAGPKLNAILDNVDNIVDTVARADIKGVVDNINAAVKDVDRMIEKINSGDGTISKLLNDGALSKNVDDAVTKVKQAVETLDNVLKDLKDDPHHYLKPLGEKKKKNRK